MSGDALDRDEVLARVRMDRRSFVKKLVVGAAFTSPIVASFAMRDTALGAAQSHFTSYAYSPYPPTTGLTHYGHRGYGPYAYSAYTFDLDAN
jgi:hypothetical protein